MLTDTLPDDQQMLMTLAAHLTADCPDMRELAREVAQQLLARHDLKALEPDNVYLHRFHTAVSSPRTFNGWQHLDQPYESLTLPQLVMHRFDAQAQDNADVLSYLAGFYSDGPGKDAYDERNEVRLEARDVLDYFWSIDFATAFKTRMTSFWAEHSENFRTLAKANFMSKLLEVCAQEPSSALARHAQDIADDLVGKTTWPPSLEALQQRVLPGGATRVCALDIGGYVATDILRLQLANGSQLIYMPGDVDCLHYFPNNQALFWWVLSHCTHVENRTRFLAHFSLDDREEADGKVGLNNLIDLLFHGWGNHDYSGLNTLDLAIEEDGFDWLRNKARQRMIDDAHFSLRSNADLRRQLWIGYLKAGLQVFGPMAAVSWPVALALVGAGIAEMGLNIYQAIHGHTTRERKAGITGAIFAAIETLFNATFLLSAPGKPLNDFADAAQASAATEEGLAPAPAEESAQEHSGEPEEESASEVADAIETWVPQPFRPTGSWDALRPFETNVVLGSRPGTGFLEGIHMQDGQFYALIDDMPYQVRFVPELQSWTVVAPDNPFSFYKSLPIRLDAAGQWRPVERLGLNGGMLSSLKIWGRPSASASVPPLPGTPYEIPADLRASLTDVSDDEITGARAFLDAPDRQAAIARFRQLRDQLAADADAFMATVQTPPRPQIPEIPANASSKTVFKTLYQNTNGLVIGEAHSGLGSKRLLIDNMRLLRKLKVKTLYMEHFTTDFQQADIDTFNRTGVMPQELDRYVEGQDVGHRTDAEGRYTFRQVLVSAQKNGVRIQPIDCMASYRQAWATPVSDVARQRMMNFHAHLIIEADQAARGSGKWIALVGSTHANTFHGVTGLAETEGALGLRVEDRPIGEPDAYSTDPGVDALDDDGALRHVQSDLRLRAGVLTTRPPSADFESLLVRPGDYAIERTNGQEYLINRSRDSTLRRTLIKRDGRFYYVERPDWPAIHERRFQNLAELHARLRLRGMQHIAP
ncbi:MULTISPECIES: membrane-targeted effector domain-containing toxin [Pseudomonas]|uniref:Dermonecrotic toxin N-terminal domain-containing protein n=1 Tax=Pseudomonas putida NBRC 14164 TaxID=1211579 RepID=A0ABM7EK34_PSEPU|nr:MULTISPECIES: membrane-targeted effector domain-containing toxin [Pseudomonas]EKT4461467.1 membrane-targeted effector domain-containing toxin [Pseudomonas putida]EKT4554522.1 membrane-targeted effector domain-containing toxin [Pseudomonas putida]MCX9135829.1 membrane-targeted effector domain-containing toxin [Pseudomonas sp. DCB_PUT]MDD1971245.1 membrane-targeted effector domain-containing toxin [Pseudomonas putida]MDO1463074.1 membrane-targeted effector domain-containing toxin [Pseudomonas